MLERLDWRDIPPEEARRIAAAVLFDEDETPLRSLEISGRRAELPFYESVTLLWITLDPPGDAEPQHLFLLDGEAPFYYALDGSSDPIHAANNQEELAIDGETAADYLRFFCFAVRGDEGPFLLFEEAAGEPAEDASEHERRLRAEAREVESRGRDESGRYLFRVPVAYAGSLFLADFAVYENGSTVMLEDEALLDDVPAEILPGMPELRRPPLIVASLQRDRANPPQPHNGDVLRILVELLLEEALETKAGSRLLSHFNTKLSEQAPLDRFSHFVIGSSPVVAIESSLPFVEETVGGIVTRRGAPNEAVKVARGEPNMHDDTRLELQIRSATELALVALHAYRGLVDAERVAHQLATREVACLIGCERERDLPDSLRQVVDLTLTLPRLDPDLFERLFQRTLGASLPDGWREGDAHWVTHVLHTDFQHPMGLELSPAEAVEYIRDRARQRLRDIEPVEGLGLSELHGLGEARAFAEDLITDIHAAIAGRLAWTHVDRGVLLVGAPGTGKTTLARAIAKDCGIRFVSASATGWQAAGHLGDHIRAMRADFAQARRFAPSILFIDEIDSIGSREVFEGHNTQYMTEVVNALLELISGLDPEAPVIVIGATNHADRVDPALKRAGRLDRVITIPRPNAEALGQIYEHYLEEYSEGELAGDVDPRELGRLSLGATGADVELFVRGAARRARKEGREIRQRDFIDEITRKPRDPASSPRLTEEEVRRVAVHEAGHALASCLSSSKGEEISFVSIVPRADGTLGFVARMPSERMLTTREEYLEQLEVILGGRAAEELVFGKDGVTGGAGGSSRSSDLAAATAWALRMITQYGLGSDGDLGWTDSPGPGDRKQAEELLRDAYVTVLTKLKENRERLDELAATLEERQELRGDEVRDPS